MNYVDAIMLGLIVGLVCIVVGAACDPNRRGWD